jgi:drug/metabolite transporter (DMT)-like permease
MTRTRAAVLTALAMVAFACNSLLCRVALRSGHIDPARFTGIRLASGALLLAAIARTRGTASACGRGNWASALALFVYAAAFSFAYVSLSASTGARLLFGAVQATMIGRGLLAGERLSASQVGGLALALAGLVGLTLPGLAAPPLQSALLMLAAGVAWGVYSLRGVRSDNPLQVTADNFLRSVPFTLILLVPWHRGVAWDATGLACAVASGAVASGLGYAIWYTVLPTLSATRAATVQLSVPVIAAVGGIALLGEPVTPRLVLASAAILGGIAVVVGTRHSRKISGLGSAVDREGSRPLAPR